MMKEIRNSLGWKVDLSLCRHLQQHQAGHFFWWSLSHETKFPCTNSTRSPTIPLSTESIKHVSTNFSFPISRIDTNADIVRRAEIARARMIYGTFNLIEFLHRSSAAARSDWFKEVWRQTNVSILLARCYIGGFVAGMASQKLSQDRIINHSKICIPLFPVRIAHTPPHISCTINFPSFIESVYPHKPYHNVFVSIVNIPSIIPSPYVNQKKLVPPSIWKKFSFCCFSFPKAKREVNISLFGILTHFELFESQRGRKFILVSRQLHAQHGLAWHGRRTFLVEDDDILLKNFSVLIHIFLALTRRRQRSIVDEHGRTEIVNIAHTKDEDKNGVLCKHDCEGVRNHQATAIKIHLMAPTCVHYIS